MAMNGNVLGVVPNTGVTVAATGSSVSGAITCTGCDALYIVNTSESLHVAVAWGVGAPTATLAADLNIPPRGTVLVGINPAITHVAAIGSGAGPTSVRFMPVLRGG